MILRIWLRRLMIIFLLFWVMIPFLVLRMVTDEPSGILTVCYGKSQFLVGKSTISMGHMFNSYVTNYQRVSHPKVTGCPKFRIFCFRCRKCSCWKSTHPSRARFCVRTPANIKVWDWKNSIRTCCAVYPIIHFCGMKRPYQLQGKYSIDLIYET